MTERIETKGLWTYTGVWRYRSGTIGHEWLDESGAPQSFTATPKNKKHYKSFAIGGVYEVTSYVDPDGSRGMFVSGTTGPKFKRRSDDPRVVEWQANATTQYAAKEAEALATKMKDDLLMEAIATLRKARNRLPPVQRVAFDVMIAAKLRGSA